MKQVALVQSRNFFTKELNNKYLGNIPLLTSTNVVEIYKFIKRNANNSCIYKYVLYVDSGVLDKYIDYIYDKKNKSINAKFLLSRCIFVAPYSNADSVREKNIQKNTKIYFSLTPISKVIRSFLGYPPYQSMLVVSNTITPYYEQIYNTNITPKFKISELTVDIINQLAKTVIILIFVGDTLEEHQKVASLVSQSNYKGVIASIELKYLEPFQPLINKGIRFFDRSSGVSLCGNVNKYLDLDTYTLYQINTSVLVNSYKLWKQYIKNNLLSIELSDYNVAYYTNFI